MIETKHIGARSELIACAWLLNQGYEVFRNVSSHGEIDVVAMKGGEIFFFDVKSSRLKNGKPQFRRISDSQARQSIVPLIVLDDGTCMIDWKARPMSEAYAERQCDRCSGRYKPMIYKQRFCSSDCRTAAFNNADRARTSL